MADLEPDPVPEDLEGDPALPDLDPVDDDCEDEETVEGLPVLAEVRAIDRISPAYLPAVQAAAAAATGFLAGAVVLAMIKRRQGRKAVRATRARRPADMLPIVGSRTFLVDVHLIAKPGE